MRRIRNGSGRYLSLSGAIRAWCNNRVVCHRGFPRHGVSGRAELGDLLLLFIYLEIGASRESCRANQFLQGGASHCALKSVILRVYCG